MKVRVEFDTKDLIEEIDPIVKALMEFMTTCMDPEKVLAYWKAKTGEEPIMKDCFPTPPETTKKKPAKKDQVKKDQPKTNINIG